jgi:hypothetical protein
MSPLDAPTFWLHFSRSAFSGARQVAAAQCRGVLRVRKEWSKAAAKIGNEWLARNK